MQIAEIKVESKTADEIQTLDAGSWFDPKYAGTKVPLLSEALDTIQKASVTLIERKGGDPESCLKLLRSKGPDRIPYYWGPLILFTRDSELGLSDRDFPTSGANSPKGDVVNARFQAAGRK